MGWGVGSTDRVVVLVLVVIVGKVEVGKTININQAKITMDNVLT